MPSCGWNDVLEGYRLYYAEGRWLQLAAALFHYDFSEHGRLLEEALRLKRSLRRGLPTTPVILRSSGTTSGVPTPYEFWPAYLIPGLEGMLKNPFGDTNAVWIREPHPLNDRLPSIAVASDSHLARIRFNIKISGRGNGSELVSLLEGLNGAAVLHCRPSSMLWLCRDAAFTAHLRAGHRISTVATSDWEPIYDMGLLRRHGIYVNDNMVDWQTGVNFYHCPNGRMHFLPMFSITGDSCENLLNLAQLGPTRLDDQVDLGKVEDCPCGRRRMAMGFVPHHRIQVDGYEEVRTLAEAVVADMEAQLAYIQFVQEEDGSFVVMHYGPSGLSEADRRMVEKAFAAIGRRVRFLENEFMICGTGKNFPLLRARGRVLRFVR